MTRYRQNEKNFLRRRLINRSGGRCEYCGEQVNLTQGDPRQATIDHVRPESKGGALTLENVKLACKACNEAKGNRDV